MNLIKTLDPDKILYIEADVNYTIFHLFNGQKHISAFTLKHHHSRIEIDSFLRLHRSFLLNPQHIKQIFKKDGNMTVRMINDTEIIVARRRRKTFARHCAGFNKMNFMKKQPRE